jgi:hypothetical protein
MACPPKMEFPVAISRGPARKAVIPMPL